MKPFLYCITLILFLCLHANAQLLNSPPFTITNSFEGRTWVATVNESDFDKAPKWNPQVSEVPPITPARAMRIAEGYVKDLVGNPKNTSNWLGAFALNAKLCRKLISPDNWYYEIVVHAGRGGFSNNYFVIIVMMDGHVPACNEIKSNK